MFAECVLAWQCAMHKSLCTGRCWQRHDNAPPGWLVELPHGELPSKHSTQRLCAWAAQSTDYAGYIRRAFTSEGLQGAVQRLPLERNFKLDHVKEVCAVVFAASVLFWNSALA